MQYLRDLNKMMMSNIERIREQKAALALEISG